MIMKPDVPTLAAGKVISDSLEQAYYDLILAVQDAVPGKELGELQYRMSDCVRAMGLEDAVVSIEGELRLDETAFNENMTRQAPDTITRFLKQQVWTEPVIPTLPAVLTATHKVLLSRSDEIAQEWLVNMISLHGAFFIEHDIADQLPGEFQMLPKIIWDGGNKAQLLEAMEMYRKQNELLAEDLETAAARNQELVEENAEQARNTSSTVASFLIPQIEKLKKAKNLYPDQVERLMTIERNLVNLMEPFARYLSTSEVGLSPTEIEVAEMIKEGKSTKEISSILHISENTVRTHRKNIRKKLGIQNTKENLRNRLLSLGSGNKSG